LGFLAEHKGHKYLIDAMRHIVKQRRDILCLIAGSGPLENSLRREIENAGLESYVKLIGFLSWNKDLPLYINASDIFVHPSISESFGIVQIEAMACGKPVVATFNGGSEEIVVSEDLGYLVEPQNSRMLAEEILKALDRNWDAGRIIDYAKGFSWKQIVKKIIKIYDEIEREKGDEAIRPISPT
jgi:glycosyltransferase involved in cell wall biosynthesis